MASMTDNLTQDIDEKIKKKHLEEVDMLLCLSSNERGSKIIHNKFSSRTRLLIRESVMEKLLFLSILLTNSLLIKSQSYVVQQKKTLLFQYYSETSSQASAIRVIALVIPRYQVSQAYHLDGNLINKDKLNISSIHCAINTSCFNCEYCSDRSSSLYILLEHILNSASAIRVQDTTSQVKQLRHRLSLIIHNENNRMNFTCTIENVNEGSKDPARNPESTTTLFGIIFISTCVVLTFALCTGWFAILYYRQFKHRRMKKKLRKALARSVQQMLDKSPIIVFDSNNNDIDDDPMCAICLESFIDAENVRKLVCSHYFHVTCIDPWLLSHQSCPLCNRDVLRDSIPSISSRILPADEVINLESVSTNTPAVIINNPIIESQNSNL